MNTEPQYTLRGLAERVVGMHYTEANTFLKSQGTQYRYIVMGGRQCKEQTSMRRCVSMYTNADGIITLAQAGTRGAYHRHEYLNAEPYANVCKTEVA